MCIRDSNSTVASLVIHVVLQYFYCRLSYNINWMHKTALNCTQFLHNVCPNQDVFLFRITFSSLHFSPVLVNSSSFLALSAHFTLLILHNNHILKLFRHTFLLSFFMVHVLLTYIKLHSR